MSALGRLTKTYLETELKNCLTHNFRANIILFNKIRSELKEEAK